MQFREFLKFSDKINHCYTLRMLDFRAGKELNKAKESYKKICKVLNLDERNIYRPNQTHTDNVKKVENEPSGIYTEDFKDVDGLITNKKNKILSLSFADCISIYLYDPEKNVIGNIHSGWQGTYKEIARNAIRKLKEEYNCNPKDIICGIGPSIGKCCFEVDKDVRDMFYNKFKDKKEINEIITKKDENKYYIDTVLINEIILKEEGINPKNIIKSNICTKCKSEKLHSFRVDKEESGRNTSIITLI